MQDIWTRVFNEVAAALALGFVVFLSAGIITGVFQ